MTAFVSLKSDVQTEILSTPRLILITAPQIWSLSSPNASPIKQSS